MTKPVKRNKSGCPIKVSDAMVQKGAELLLFFNPENNDHEEYARKIYVAMAEVFDSES